MHKTFFDTAAARVAAIAFATLLVTACASTGGSERAKSTPTSPAMEQEAAVAVTAPPPAARSEEEKASRRSPLVQPGQDPTQPGPSVDMRAAPEGFRALPADLEARVEKRWELLIAGKGEEAFEFLTAGVRSSLKPATYGIEMRSRPIKWVSAEALDGQCEATSCVVRVLVNIKFTAQGPASEEVRTDSVVSERWIKVGGVWSHIPDQYLEGFAK